MTDLTGAIDLHVHCSPDLRPRKMTAIQLATAARDAGMRALLLKNHDMPTTGTAGVVREAVPGIEVFGGVVLNPAVGGLNADAADMALRAGAREVWMPTYCAEHERAHQGNANTGITILDDGGRLKAAVLDILALVARANAIVGTGHLSPQEIAILVRAAREAGVKKIVITHPEIRSVNLAAQMQREIAGPDVWFERCYVRELFALNWDEFAARIREIGYESTVLATDLGQPANIDPVNGLREMHAQLSARGFSEQELRWMMKEAPARLLDLE